MSGFIEYNKLQRIIAKNCDMNEFILNILLELEVFLAITQNQYQNTLGHLEYKFAFSQTIWEYTEIVVIQNVQDIDVICHPKHTAQLIIIIT